MQIDGISIGFAICGYLLIGALGATTVDGAFGLQKKLNEESRVVVGVASALLLPLVILAGVVWIFLHLPQGIAGGARYMGRGFRDLYRLARPEKVKLPEARVVR